MAPADHHRALDVLDLEARFLACGRRIAENPADAAAYRERALLWARKQDDASALADLDHAVSLDPTDAHAYALRGLIWESRGDHQQALSDLNVAMGLASDGGDLFRTHRDRVLAQVTSSAGRQPAPPGAAVAGDRRGAPPSAPSAAAAAPRQAPPNTAGVNGPFDALVAACQEAGRRPHDFETSLLARGFGPSATGLARAVFVAFGAAVSAAAGGPDPDAPWQMVRGLVLDLHNRSSARAAAAMLDGILAVADRTPPTAPMREAMWADKKALRQHALYPLLQRAAKAGQWADALNHIDELLYLETDPDELGRLRTWRVDIVGQRRRQAVTRWSIAIGGIAVMLAAVVAGLLWWQSASRPVAAGSPSSSPAWPAAPSTARVDIPPAGLEVPPIADLPLTSDNIRYCLFQDVRLRAARAVVATDAQRTRLDAISADLKQRCSDATFYAMQFSSEVPAQRSRLEAEGRAMVANWKAVR